MEKYNITINDINILQDLIVVSWEANIGFGETRFMFHDKKLTIDTECLDIDFISELLDRMKEYVFEHGELLN